MKHRRCRQKRITRESLQNLISSIKIIWHRSRSSGRSKTRIMYIRTVFLMQSWNLKRNIRRLRTESMRHSAINIIWSIIWDFPNLHLWNQERRSGRITNIRSTVVRSFYRMVCILQSLSFSSLCVLSRRSRRELLFLPIIMCWTFYSRLRLECSLHWVLRDWSSLPERIFL